MIPRANTTPIIQATLPALSSQYETWAPDTLGRLVLPDGARSILDLTSSVTLVDQGRGATNAANGVYLDLTVNGNRLLSIQVASAGHSITTQTFDLASNRVELADVNALLSGIDWSGSPVVAVSMETHPSGFVGSALYTANDELSITTDVVPVPEPSGLAVAALALGMLGVVYRGRNSRFGTGRPAA